MTQVLKVLSEIWKSGAEIVVLPNGSPKLEDYQLVPNATLKAFQLIFPQIKNWFKSWEGAKAIEIHMKMMVHQSCGWQHNQKLNKWICTDVEALTLFIEWQEILAKNGWNDIYEDYRQYENETSNAMKKKLYERAVLYANQNK
ncbi:Uncharacterised protein [Lysinibacillus capsici]|uniref:Uncharacterized protein n=1 Tax=Lysinibacillus capsici TaxID=2115968 RepID=A0A2X0ZBP7_9BACI|nr:hypothetical protein [Lysinibacillus capsici]SPT99162.1 Uncharacterised protein [Lysinibacillus capsici]